MNVEVIQAITMKEDNTEKQTMIVSPYIRVSTESEQQLGSYESQITHYTNMINQNPKWELGEVYADEGISGTQTNKRDEFQRMIKDAINNKMDMIITKSISRFARNTVDTLKYVRRLKEFGVAIYFEKENINTLTMDGEVLLTILSSLAQQESESLSSNVKMGIKMKMQRGELVGSHRCLGYDYDKETKTLTINEKEAKIVRYIFKRYLEGAGGMVISGELGEKGYKTIRGNTKWDATSVINILKNEKYVGDILQGKTITTDPITKRKLRNRGEQEQYLIKNYHKPIISRETFERVQEIFNKRSVKVKDDIAIRTKYSRKHAFSSITRCGHCGSPTTRRKWHSGKPYQKYVWQCTNYLKNGKDSCPESKAIDELVLEDAFIHTFNKLQESDNNTINEFVENFAEMLKNNDHTKEIRQIETDIEKLDDKLNNLIDMRLECLIDKDTYEAKYNEIYTELTNLKAAKEEIEKANAGDATIKKRIRELEEVLSNQKDIMVEFDRDIFEMLISEVILGEEKEDGEINPYTITFKLKSGIMYQNEILFHDGKRKDMMAYANYRIHTFIFSWIRYSK